MRAETADSEPFDLTTADGRWRFAQARMRELLAFARRHTGVIEVAHDAVAHAVAHANESPCRTEGQLFVWLAKLVRNFVVDDVRAHGSARALALLAGTARTVRNDPQDIVPEADEDAWLLNDVVASLSERERRAFDVLAAGGDIRDIAREFGITPKAVETLLWRTRSRCKRKVAAARAGLGALLPWFRPRRTQVAAAMVAPLTFVGAFVVAPRIERLPVVRPVVPAAGPQPAPSPLRSPKASATMLGHAGQSATPTPSRAHQPTASSSPTPDALDEDDGGYGGFRGKGETLAESADDCLPRVRQPRHDVSWRNPTACQLVTTASPTPEPDASP